MARFPKGLLLAAVILELMAFTLDSSGLVRQATPKKQQASASAPQKAHKVASKTQGQR